MWGQRGLYCHHMHSMSSRLERQWIIMSRADFNSLPQRFWRDIAQKEKIKVKPHLNLCKARIHQTKSGCFIKYIYQLIAQSPFTQTFFTMFSSMGKALQTTANISTQLSCNHRTWQNAHMCTHHMCSISFLFVYLFDFYFILTKQS